MQMGKYVNLKRFMSWHNLKKSIEPTRTFLESLKHLNFSELMQISSHVNSGT